MHRHSGVHKRRSSCQKWPVSWFMLDVSDTVVMSDLQPQSIVSSLPIGNMSSILTEHGFSQA